MASKQDRIAEKARARKKARDRDRHRVAASRRQHMSKVRDISVEEAAAWPLAECYVGDKWHEDGARVPAIFVRKHPSGRVSLPISNACEGAHSMQERATAADRKLRDFRSVIAVFLIAPKRSSCRTVVRPLRRQSNRPSFDHPIWCPRYDH